MWKGAPMSNQTAAWRVNEGYIVYCSGGIQKYMTVCCVSETKACRNKKAFSWEQQTVWKYRDRDWHFVLWAHKTRKVLIYEEYLNSKCILSVYEFFRRFKRFLLCLTQLDVVGVEQEVGQIEELWDQLSDVSHVVFRGRLPLFLYTVEHPLWDIKPSLWGEADTAMSNKLCNRHINKVVCLMQCSESYFILLIVLHKQEIFATIRRKLFIFPQNSIIYDGNLMRVNVI